MTSTEKQSDILKTATAKLFEVIAAELDQVENILGDELSSDSPFVDELLQYGCLLGGKRLRPALLLLSGRAVGSIAREHLLLGAVVEMIHTATLIHDDVLDDAHVRRHLATVNSRWDTHTSVLLGDFLFTHAFFLASQTGSTYACETIGRSTNVVCAGELRQVGERGNFNLTEDEYLQIIGAKTAELCACSCRLGASFAGARETETEKFARYGWHLGTAFQIADDLLDLLGDEAQTGKSLGTDLDQGKATLPVIHALRNIEPSRRGELVELLTDQVAPEAARTGTHHILTNLGSYDYAREKAIKLAHEAQEQIDYLPPSPEADVLRILPEFAVTRSR